MIWRALRWSVQLAKTILVQTDSLRGKPSELTVQAVGASVRGRLCSSGGSTKWDAVFLTFSNSFAK